MTINMMSGSKVNQILWGAQACVSIVGTLIGIKTVSGVFNTVGAKQKKDKQAGKDKGDEKEKIKTVKCKVVKDKTKKKK